jgi:hypothetical protein
MLEEIRKRLREVPFREFFIHLADGRKITVPHSDFVWMPAPGVLHVWLEAEKASERVNPLLIIGVESRQQIA